MNQALLTGVEIASAISVVITTIFVVAVRVFWRRAKSLKEP